MPITSSLQAAKTDLSGAKSVINCECPYLFIVKHAYLRSACGFHGALASHPSIQPDPACVIVPVVEDFLPRAINAIYEVVLAVQLEKEGLFMQSSSLISTYLQKFIGLLTCVQHARSRPAAIAFEYWANLLLSYCI